MTAVIRHLEDTLPKVPSDTPRVRTGRTNYGADHRGNVTRTTNFIQTAAEKVVEIAAKRLERIGNRHAGTGHGGTSTKPASVSDFAAASIYRLVASRVDMAKYSKHPEKEIRDLQKTLSLLTWELGTILEDIDLAEITEKEDKK